MSLKELNQGELKAKSDPHWGQSQAMVSNPITDQKEGVCRKQKHRTKRGGPSL